MSEWKFDLECFCEFELDLEFLVQEEQRQEGILT